MNEFFKKHFHIFSIPPLLPIIFAFIMGILIQSLNWSAITVLFFVGLFFCISGFFYVDTRKNQIIYGFIYCAFALFGAYLYNKNIQDYNDFYLFSHNKLLEIMGVVIDKENELVSFNTSTVITLSIHEVNNGEQIKKLYKTAMFYGSEQLDSLSVGDTVTFFDVYCRKPDNESFVFYQIKEQIVATVFNRQFKFVCIDHPVWSLRRWIYEQRQQLFISFKKKLSTSSFLFFASLFLGNRASVKSSIEEVNEHFKRWGIYHFLSRSGMHLALFIMVWRSILQLVPIPFLVRQLILIIISFIYYLLSWSSAPFIRSFALVLFNKMCVVTNASYHSLHYLLLICFCFLMYCPLYLFFLDFQLSFFLTFVLIWLNQLQGQCLYEEYGYKKSNY